MSIQNSLRKPPLPRPFSALLNDERPHQGLSCHNLPPRVAFPRLPILPTCPMMVNADRWLEAYANHTFTRTVRRDGQVLVANWPYDVQVRLVGQQVALRVDADAGQFVVEADGRAVQRLAINGLGLGTLPFATFVERLCVDARMHRAVPQTYGRQRPVV